MAQYLLTYHGGAQPESKEARNKHMADWMKWIETLGTAVADSGHPISITKTIASDGKVADSADTNPAHGYSLLSADDINAAAKLLQACPLLKIGGSIEIHETMDM